MALKLSELYSQLNQFIRKYQLQAMREVLIFTVITIGFHFLFRAFSSQIMSTWPVPAISGFTVDLLFKNSLWFNVKVLGMTINTVDTTMLFPDCGYIGINHSCSAVKQFMQWLVLMILYPGPWRHKLWYIPVGLFILHLTNIFRIVGLSVVLLNWPAYWDWSHDWVFRPFFYVVIFAMWVLWVERFSNRSLNKRSNKQEIKPTSG
jgi:exosortase/archaeosortase family protein